MKDTIQNKKGNFYLLALLLAISMVWNGCSKEELSIYDVPREEQRSSYYELADRTIELNAEDLSGSIIEKEDYKLTLRSVDKFADLEVGDVLITDLTIPNEECILREVLTIERSADRIIVTTQPSTVLKAYSRFRIDSNLPGIIQVRDGYAIGPAFASLASVFNQVLAAFKKAELISYSISGKVKLNGEIGWVAEHPNDIYIYENLCPARENCTFSENELDSDGNGVYDVVETYFDNDFSDEIYRQGYYELRVSNFQIEELQFSAGKSVRTEEKGADDIYKEIKSYTTAVTTGMQDDGNNLNYILTPGLNVGVFGVNFTWGPIISSLVNAKLTANLSLKDSDVVDIILANYQVNGEEAESTASFRFEKNGMPSSFSELIGSSRLDIGVGISGSIVNKYGIAVGMALTVGEATTAGVSFGAVFEAGFYMGIPKAEVGIKVVDLLQAKGPTTWDFSGSICFDAGLFYDFKLFTDANLIISSIPDELDVKVKFPKEAFGLTNFSFLQFFDDAPNNLVSVTSKGICFTTKVECQQITLVDVAVSSIASPPEGNSATVDFRVDNPLNPSGTYEIAIDAGGTSFSLGAVNETFFYGETYNVAVADPTGAIDIAYVNNQLSLVVSDQTYDCSKFLDQSQFAFLVNCDAENETKLETNTNSLDEVRVINDALDNPVTYFSFEAAKSHCAQLTTGLMTAAEALQYLEDHCVNPTGYILNQQIEEIIERDEIAIWVQPPNDSQSNFLKARIGFENGERRLLDIETEFKPSQSVFAPCLCVN